ncbi:hypothetical protein L596_000557 [Steinernema carpocapsae]|uniref:Uncharacterized protein n=1 Tax=Steinernema carpocapsae TaxID=34508 RepID=A0A4U8UIS5_STECR|nr:hypothetical protein L596_000557 [Steinernema carpocapsae]
MFFRGGPVTVEYKSKSHKTTFPVESSKPIGVGAQSSGKPSSGRRAAQPRDDAADQQIQPPSGQHHGNFHSADGRTFAL